MARFLSVHNLSITAKQLAEALSKADIPSTIKWVGSNVAENDGKIFAICEAADKDTYSDALKALNFATDEIYEVTLLSPENIGDFLD